MVMTRYETIIELGDTFMQLMAKGFIPVHILDYKVYYEAYLAHRELKCIKSDAVDKVAIHYDISKRKVYHIISFMENT